MMLDGLDAKSGGNMSFVGAGTAEVPRPAHELAAVQLTS